MSLANIKVIIIAHNQLELVKKQIDILQAFCQVDTGDIIVVDNFSKDGLDVWLASQNINYLLCDEGVESYSNILNTAVNEFSSGEDIFILRPNYIIIQDALNKMQQRLHSDSNIGAVTGTVIPCGASEEGKDYISAVEYAQKQTAFSTRDTIQLGLPAEAVLIKAEMLKKVGVFDNQMILPQSVILDFLLRGIRCGYQYLMCGNAFFYGTGVLQDDYDCFANDIDREVMKKKWNMKYFGVEANKSLVSEINSTADEELAVLEIGCDCGANLAAVKNRFPKAKLFGIEINRLAAEIAASVAEVCVGNIENRNFDFKDVKFDYILFGDVLEHLRDPEGTIGYCRNLLKENGRIIASIPNLMHYSVIYELINGNFTYRDTGLLDCTHIHFFTYYEIKDMFQRQNFDVEKVVALSAAQELSQEAESFVDKLVNLSDRANRVMFKAYQYIVIAKDKGETADDANT